MAETPLAPILDSIGDAILVLDRERRLIYVNASAERLTGIAREDLLGNHAFASFPSSLAATLDAAAQGAFDRGPIGVQYYSERLSRWYELRVHATPNGIMIVGTDIDERHRADGLARETQQRYQQLFETTNDGILIVDDEGRYVDVNPSYCRILKATRGRLIGSHFSEFIPSELLNDAITAFANLKSGKPTPVEFPLRALDGTIVYLEWTSSARYLPNLSFCVCRHTKERVRTGEE